MNCIIVDDEELSRLALKKCVEQVKHLKLLAVCNDAVEATEVLQNNAVDLIFLDIEMPNMTGIELVKNFKVPQIIFITSKSEFASEAFELDVFGAPTFLVNNKLFWGQDRLEYAIDELKR